MANEEIRTDAIVTLRHAAEANNAEASRCRADADKMQADVNELRARAGWFTAMADRWDRIATFIENGTFDLDYLLSGDDLDEARRAGAEQAPAAADEATEAFVAAADAERYAQRDEYVNAERTTLAEQLRAHGAEQAAQDAEADAFHAQQRADETDANGEYVDYDEADAVREIHEEMALEAAGVESWDQL